MKKLCHFLLFIIVMIMLMSCVPMRKEPFKEGTFYTNSDFYNVFYSDVRLEVKRISNHEFESRNGENVVEDILTKYKYSLNLLIYCNETNKLEETVIYDVYPMEGKTLAYYSCLIRFPNVDSEQSYYTQLGMSSNDIFFLSIGRRYDVYDCVSYHLFLESYTIDAGEYYSLKSYGDKIFEKSKVILTEVTYDEYEKLEYNKIKGVYNNQYLKMELFLYDSLKDEYIDTKIFDIKYMGIGSGYIRDKFSRVAYKGKISFIMDGEIIESDIMIYYNKTFIIEVPKILCNEYGEAYEENF